MIITEQERKDLVALFNAQDAADKLRRKVVIINGSEVTCYETGEIERTHPKNAKVIRTFGSLSGSGYFQITVKGKKLQTHQVIFEAFNGKIPKGMQVDHIDGDKQNNCIDNLRALTRLDNSRAKRKKNASASSKYRGVSWFKAGGRWRVTIQVCGKSVHLGYFESEVEAAMAYDAGAIRYGYLDEALNFKENPIRV